jgi:hypothetical protein
MFPARDVCRGVVVRSLALSRITRSFRPFSSPVRLPFHATRVGRLAGPLGATLVVAGATVTAAVGGSAAGTMAASGAGDASGAVTAALAAEPFAAGQLGVVDAPLPAVAAAAQVERATRTGSLLGLPSATRRSASRIVDRFGGRTYDEVAEYDAQGRLISLQRFDPDGRLLAAVRFGLRGDGGAPLAGAVGARQRAERLVSTLGLDAAGTPRIVAAPSNVGWTVAWDRVVGGIPVPGDGLRIQLWPDGSVHGLARSERTLAPRPAVLLEAARARSIAEAKLDSWFAGQTRGDASVSGLALAWVPPNDTFAVAAPDAPAAVLRLAWVVRVTTGGTLSDSLRALEIYVDAGDGSVLGGDVLR